MSSPPETATTDAETVVRHDLDYMVANLEPELAELAGKRLLITGGAGFLGYYLVRSVLHWNAGRTSSRRVSVTVHDNFIRGVPKWLARLDDDRDLRVVRRDVTEPLDPVVDDYHFIVHAAGIASPTYYRLHPIETMDANVNGLWRLLDHCRRRAATRVPVEGVLFFSSSEIYGDPAPEFIPTGETYRGNVSCTGPRACYDESKRFGETLCVNFAQQFALPVKIARPFNNYGPGLKITDRRVLPDLARDILEGRDLVLLSDGTPTRTFCYVADAVVGYYKVLVRGRPGEAYNIGVAEPEVSIAELAERMRELGAQLVGYGGAVVRNVSEEAGYLTDNPHRRCPIVTKARDELDYRPSISLDEGLRRSLLWYRENATAEEA